MTFTPSVDQGIGGECRAYVEVRCDTSPPFVYAKAFQLNKSLVKSLAIIYAHTTAVLDVYDIPRDVCRRRVKLVLSGKPAPGLAVLMRILQRAGIEVDVEVR